MDNLLYIYTCELFPTVVRNSALGLASQVGQIGSISAPLVVAMATVNPSLPFVSIGVLAFKLRQTLNRTLSETMAASAFQNGDSIP
jgi:OCT family organic cation transporter-like MFS transporter 4/5